MNDKPLIWGVVAMVVVFLVLKSKGVNAVSIGNISTNVGGGGGEGALEGILTDLGLSDSGGPFTPDPRFPAGSSQNPLSLASGPLPSGGGFFSHDLTTNQPVYNRRTFQPARG